MISKLIKIANRLDAEGKAEKADRLDNFILKYAQEEKEPSPEELMAEEDWLEEEGINPYNLTNEEALEGLEGDDRMVAEEYMGGTKAEQIREMLSELKGQQEIDVERELKQQKIMDQLSQVLMVGIQEGNLDPAKMDRGQFLTPEASLVQDFAKLADMLDETGMHKKADYFTNILEKIAQHGWDDQFFDDPNAADRDDEDFINPDEEELLALEDPKDTKNHEMLLLEFVDKLSRGMYISLDAAKMEARELLKSFEGSYNIPEYGMLDFEPRQGERASEEKEPDNVLSFPNKVE